MLDPKFGWIQRPIVNTEGKIIDGHLRLALEKLQGNSLPVDVVVADIPEDLEDFIKSMSLFPIFCNSNLTLEDIFMGKKDDNNGDR